MYGGGGDDDDDGDDDNHGCSQVEAGGVEAIVENIKLCTQQPLQREQVALLRRAGGPEALRDTRLQRYCYQLLTIVADSNFGRKKIQR
jgi:hypothetical protein